MKRQVCGNWCKVSLQMPTSSHCIQSLQLLSSQLDSEALLGSRAGIKAVKSGMQLILVYAAPTITSLVVPEQPDSATCGTPLFL